MGITPDLAVPTDGKLQVLEKVFLGYQSEAYVIMSLLYVYKQLDYLCLCDFLPNETAQSNQFEISLTYCENTTLVKHTINTHLKRINY